LRLKEVLGDIFSTFKLTQIEGYFIFMSERARKPNISEINTLYPYDRILAALDHARKVHSTKAYAEQCVSHADSLARDIQIQSGVEVVAAFGTGYPYYLLSPELPDTFDIPEFQGYLDGVGERLGSHMSANGHDGWICAGCQEAGGFNDLKTFCYPCERVDFKPRHLFRALPDVDITVVVKQDSDLLPLSEFIERRGVVISDADIRGTIDRLLGLGESGKKEVLTDLHVVDEETLNRSIREVLHGETDVHTPVLSYRGRGTWHEGEELPFWHDLLIGVTPVGDETEGNIEIWRAFDSMVRGCSTASLLDRYMEVHPNEKIVRMLECEPTRFLIENSLKARMDQAREVLSRH
jgi:hypothetical protein